MDKVDSSVSSAFSIHLEIQGPFIFRHIGIHDFLHHIIGDELLGGESHSCHGIKVTNSHQMILYILPFIRNSRWGNDRVTKNFKGDLTTEIIRNFAFLLVINMLASSERLRLLKLCSGLNDLIVCLTRRRSSTTLKRLLSSVTQLSEKDSTAAIASFVSGGLVSSVAIEDCRNASVYFEIQNGIIQLHSVINHLWKETWIVETNLAFPIF